MILMITSCLLALLIRIKFDNNKNSLSNFRDAELFDFAFSFQRQLDAKYMGLAVFLAANILTGLVNLYAENIKIDGSSCEFILLTCLSTSLAIIIPTATKHYYRFIKNISSSL